MSNLLDSFIKTEKVLGKDIKPGDIILDDIVTIGENNLVNCSTNTSHRKVKSIDLIYPYMILLSFENILPLWIRSDSEYTVKRCQKS